MGLPANFWATAYTANYFKHDFSAITDGGQTNYGVSTWKSNLLTNCGDIVQIEGAQNDANPMHNHNHGYWYLRGQTTGKDLPITFLQVSGQTVLLPSEQLPPTAFGQGGNLQTVATQEGQRPIGGVAGKKRTGDQPIPPPGKFAVD